jgi:ABC-type phosphate transport system ATPase subunit
MLKKLLRKENETRYIVIAVKNIISSGGSLSSDFSFFENIDPLKLRKETGMVHKTPAPIKAHIKANIPNLSIRIPAIIEVARNPREPNSLILP